MCRPSGWRCVRLEDGAAHPSALTKRSATESALRGISVAKDRAPLHRLSPSFRAHECQGTRSLLHMTALLKEAVHPKWNSLWLLDGCRAAIYIYIYIYGRARARHAVVAGCGAAQMHDMPTGPACQMDRPPVWPGALPGTVRVRSGWPSLCACRR